LKARLYSIGLTIVLTILASLILTNMLGADFFAVLALHRIYHRFLVIAAASAIKFTGWTLAIALLTLCFAIIYCEVKTRRWYWLTPGGNVWHPRLVRGLSGAAPLPSFLKQLLHRLRLLGCSDDLAHVVLHHRPHAPCRRRDK
jgi:hypothetical protein